MFFFGNEKRIFSMKKIKDWYMNNIGKILFLIIVVVAVYLTVAHIPYLSFILSPGIRLFIVVLCFYLLFPLSTNKLVFISVIIIFFAFIFSFLELSFISNSLGDFLYLELLLIFINYIRVFLKDRNKVVQ